MDKITSCILTFLFMLPPSTATGHPLKMSLSIVKYDSEEKVIEMGAKVFADDFQRSIFRTVLKGVDPSQLTEDKKHRSIESYFNRYYGISVNEKTLPLRLRSYEFDPEQYVFVFKFIGAGVSLKKGDALKIQNRLFFEDFGPMQTNNVMVTFPEYDVNDRRVARVGDDTFTYTLGGSKDGWFSNILNYWMGTHR